MKNVRLIMVLVAFVLLLGAQTSFAAKNGFFLDLASGSGEFEYDYDSDSFDIDSSSFAFGYAFDTDPEPSKVFSYRLNVGFVRHKFEDDYGGDLTNNGLYAESVFGFAFIRTDELRWWGGPLVRIGFYSGDEDDIDYDYAEFAFGVATGWNFKSGNVVFSPSLGVRFTGYAGEAEDAGWSEDFEANATNAYLNFAILF